MANDSIKPALSAEEWKLPVQDQLNGYGFTQHDIRRLREAAAYYRTGTDSNTFLHSLADRIEALLPPESAT